MRKQHKHKEGQIKPKKSPGADICTARSVSVEESVLLILSGRPIHRRRVREREGEREAARDKEIGRNRENR